MQLRNNEIMSGTETKRAFISLINQTFSRSANLEHHAQTESYANTSDG